MWDSKILFKPSTIREPSKCCVGLSKDTGFRGAIFHADLAWVTRFLWKCCYLGYSQICWIITLPTRNGPLGSIPHFHTLPRVHGISLTIPMLEAICSADAAWWPHSGGPLAPKWQRSQIKTSDAQSNPSTASNPKTSSDSSADLEKLYRGDQYCTIL